MTEIFATTVQAFDLILSSVAGQRNNPCFEYLRDVMQGGMDRRRDDDESAVSLIELPISEDDIIAHMDVDPFRLQFRSNRGTRATVGDGAFLRCCRE